MFQFWHKAAAMSSTFNVTQIWLIKTIILVFGVYCKIIYLKLRII